MDVIELASRVDSIGGFERAVLDVLAGELGAQAAFFATATATTTLGLDERRVAATLADPRVVAETLPLETAALGRRGVATDTEILGEHRVRCAYFRALAAPLRGRHSLIGFLRVRGSKTAAVMLGRCGDAARAFSAAEIAHVESVLPALAIAHASYAPRPPLPGLSRRERDVLDYLCLGYTNREIGLALGTSANTVRNQLVALFAKLGASTRAEAVALARG
jgi:DNA-binding CsgD family transcriptional regulator